VLRSVAIALPIEVARIGEFDANGCGRRIGAIESARHEQQRVVNMQAEPGEAPAAEVRASSM